MGALYLLVLITMPLGGRAITSPVATNDTGGLGINSRPAAIVVETYRILAHRIELVSFGEIDAEVLSYPVWSLESYAAGEPPLRYLDKTGPAQITPWGNSGLAGGFRETVHISQPVFGFLPPTGQVVVGVESTARTLLAGAQQTRNATYMGAVWQTDEGVRGLLPHSITWALDVYASYLPGEIVALGPLQWEQGFGDRYDGADLLRWQREASWGATVAAPEGKAMKLWATGLLLFSHRSRASRAA